MMALNPSPTAKTLAAAPGKRIPRHEAEVLRELFFADPRFTIRGIMRTTATTRGNILSLLTNRIHRNEGSIIPNEVIMALDHEKRFNIPDDQVLGARIAALETGGAFGIDMVAATGDLDPSCAADLLTGRARPDVSIFVPFQVVGARPCLNDNEVVYWRKRYRDDESVTPTGIAEAVGCEVQMIHKMLHGTRRQYAHLPGAIDKLRRTHEPRGLTDEVALFIRLQFNPKIVTVKMLSRHYNYDEDAIRGIIDHETYKDVPYVEPKPKVKFGREYTDEQVIAARLDFFSGAKTPKQIAEDFGFKTSAHIYGMLVGIRYADVPGVPEEVLRAAQKKGKDRKRGRIAEAMQRRKRPIIPVRSVRFSDHDERFDQRMVAAQ